MFGLENNGFLINLAVSLLIALITLLYFRQQLATIDHKVNSMFSLMTSMTQELNSLSRLNLSENENETPQNSSGGQLINVSEGEEEEDESEDESSDDESGNEENSVDLLENNDIKTFNMGSELTGSSDIKVIDMNNDEDDEDESSYDSSNDVELKNLVTDLMEQTIELNDNSLDEELEPIELPIETLGEEDVATLENENTVKSVDVPIDYSKMSVKALKDIVSSKNLASNISKMKKQELIDLLSL